MTDNHHARMLTRVAKPYNKVKWIWVFGLVAFMILGAIITIFADIGVSIAEKTIPHYLHGKYLNYDNLWLLISIWTVTFPVFIITATISLMTHNLPVPDNIQKESTK